MTMERQSGDVGEYGYDTHLQAGESGHEHEGMRFGGEQMTGASELASNAYGSWGYSLRAGHWQRDLVMLLAGAALGAGLMYVLDPAAGRRRRALMRDKAVHAGHVTRDAMRGTVITTRNRARGVIASTRAAFCKDTCTDEQLEARVRSALGRACSHPGSIAVSCRGGNLVLSGQVLASELDGLLRGMRAVRGVITIENHLQAHDNPGRVPGLQG